MTREEVITLMKTKEPVICDNIQYAYIYEYVLQIDAHGRNVLQVGLMDKNKNCVVRTSLDKVSIPGCN